MTVFDSEVIAELTGSGAQVDDYFLINHEICCVNRNRELMSLLVEDLEGEAEGEMHFAIVDFLRRRGAKLYESHDDYHRRKSG